MQDDDLYPSDGSYFGVPLEPVEQIISRKQEKAETLQAKAEIERVIRHFEERIKYRDSIDAITTDLEREPAMHQKLIEVNKLLKMALIEEKQLLEELLDIHAR
jgi:predicted component of type VI protein secretion system